MSDGWRPISVAKEDRLKYFEALEANAVGGDVEPFAMFVAELKNMDLEYIF